jgi:hypothetical protein
MAGEPQSRALGVTYKKEQSFIRLDGYIDEFANYAPLLTHNPPLKLILAGIVAINSQGIRKWIRFIRDYGLKALELHECPPVFIDACNMIPDIVSPNLNMKRIKSVIVPQSCKNCVRTYQLVVDVQSVVVQHNVVTLQRALCKSCGMKLTLDIDPSDHFLFMTCG